MNLPDAIEAAKRLRSAVPRAASIFILLVLAAGIYLGISANRDFRRMETALQAEDVLREFRCRLQDAQSAGRLVSEAEVPPGLLARISDGAGLQQRLRQAQELYRGEPGIRAELDSLVLSTSSALGAARETILARLQLDLAKSAEPDSGHQELESALTASADSLRTLLAEARRHLITLDAHPRQGLDRGVATTRMVNILLLTSLGISILSLLFVWRERKKRDRHLLGALLVDDMLEAYSRRLEQMNAELEQLNAMKTQFLANTSHELLTPLNGMLGALEVLREGGCTGKDEEREFLTDATRSGEQLLGLIHDLLDLCHLEEGSFTVDCKEVRFGPIVDGIVARYRPATRRRDLALIVTPPHQGWPSVHADGERLGKVMDHLLSNAVKFTESGSIRIQGRLETEGDPRLFLEIVDTGVGIASKKLREVFDLFRQADASHTRRFGGTGLGLTLSRHLVRAMGGQIGIESDGPGRGTRVWFTIPLLPAQEDALPGASGPDTAAPGERPAA